MSPDLSVIIPTHGPPVKLRSLLASIARSSADHHRFEVVVTVDGRDEQPLAVARETLPESIRFVGQTQEHAGPAAARNAAMKAATGEWVVFFDDDAIVEPETIAGHLRWTNDNPDSTDALLGRVDGPSASIDSPWRTLLANSSMVFFWNRMQSSQTYGYRHFWTTNLSVRRECVLAVGGFDEAFPTAMHEDIELGWRLTERFGTRVCVDTSIRCLHDHPLDLRDYLLREHKSGVAARAARVINPAFHDDIWGWIDDPDSTHRALHGAFAGVAPQVLAMLEAWAEPSDEPPTAEALNAMYVAHLPLKRLFFIDGYVNRSFDGLWTELCDQVRANDASLVPA